MKIKRSAYTLSVVLLSALMAVSFAGLCYEAAVPAAAQPGAAVKWVNFTIPGKAMSKAMDIDIKSVASDSGHIDWIELLAILGTKYGGNWRLYKASDMDAAVKRLQAGERAEEILKGYTSYDYYYTAYDTVLGGFLGYFQKDVPDKNNPGQTVVQDYYGLRAYFPIAEGFAYSHYRDFGASRSYGYNRGHTGNDLCGSVGTPIIAVESGIVEELGWNQYGGWRIGIRSFDKQRYYYYAHLRKRHPFAAGLELGGRVQAGDVIGYMGITGYSVTEDVNNMKVPHLHFGVQLVFDESQKDGVSQNWIDVYDILEVLARNRTTVVRIEESKDYVRKYKMYEDDFE